MRPTFFGPRPAGVKLLGVALKWFEVEARSCPGAAVYLAAYKDMPLLILGFYTYSMAVSDDVILVWFMARSETVAIAALQVSVFDVRRMEPIPEIASAVESLTRRDRGMAAASSASAEFQVRCNLEAGTHRFEFPRPLAAVDEILVVRQPIFGLPLAIWSMRPSLGMIEVMPQLWFTPERFDYQYQWVTRVARDPDSRELVGDGIRVEPFRLTPDGDRLL
jgi:hypothetical protein